MLDLAEDGTLVTGYVVLVGGTYTLQGDRLCKRYSDGAQSEERVSILGDTLSHEMEDILPGFMLPYRRVGLDRSDAAPIVGVWEPEIDAPMSIRERYTHDGRFLLRHVMAGAKDGTWRFEDGTLSIIVDDSTTRYAVDRAENALTLTPKATDSRRTITYVGSDRWYDFAPMTAAEAAEIVEGLSDELNGQEEPSDAK